MRSRAMSAMRAALVHSDSAWGSSLLPCPDLQRPCCRGPKFGRRRDFRQARNLVVTAARLLVGVYRAGVAQRCACRKAFAEETVTGDSLLDVGLGRLDC